MVKNRLQCKRRKSHGFNPWVRKIPWRRAWQPTPVFLPGKSHGQRFLIGYSPCCFKELDTTELNNLASKQAVGTKEYKGAVRYMTLELGQKDMFEGPYT